MLRIACPYCGCRDETEFRFGGEVRGPRPGLDVSDSEWADYLFHLDNARGLQSERWCHAFGCGQWFDIVRNTVTHEIVAVDTLGDPRPEIEA